MFNSEYFIEEFIDNSERLLSILDESLETNQISPPVYRGVGSGAFTLIPSAFRPEGQETLFQILKSAHSNRDYIHLDAYLRQSLAEAHALAEFYRVSERSGAEVSFVSERVHDILTSNFMDVTESFWRETFIEREGIGTWPQIDFHRLLGLAQHYGLPTRLLDWSFDPHIACYFAASSYLESEGRGDADEHFAVWVLSQHALAIQGQFVDPSGQVNFDTKIVFVKPPYSGNANLRAQKGCFTIVSCKDYETYKDVFEHGFDHLRCHFENQGKYPDQIDDEIFSVIKSLGSKIFRKLVVPGKEAANLIFLLRKRNVSPSTVFPDFNGVAKDVLLRARLS